MLDALSSALFKTTGDEQFKVEEKPKDFNPEEHDATRKREAYVGDYKYHVPKIGETGSSSHYVDDSAA